MRPGVIINLNRFSEQHPTEDLQEGLESNRPPLERLEYCIDELDKEIAALSSKAPCEVVLAARQEIAGLKNLLTQLELDRQTRFCEYPAEAKEKTGNYRKVIEELIEERDRLEREISDLDKREKLLKLTKAASPASQAWQTDFDE